MERDKASGILTVFLALVTVLVIGAAAYGAATKTFYVSPGGVNSSTCGTGGGNPCRTINYTLKNRATSNSTLLLADGTYAENVLLDADKDLITLAGNGPTLCKIAAPSTEAPAVQINGIKAALKGLTISGGGEGLSPTGAMVMVQQCSIQNVVFALASNLEFANVTVKNLKGPGISLSHNSAAQVSSCTLTGCAGPAIMAGQNSSLYMEKSIVTGNNTGLTGALGAINLFGNSSATLTGNNISSNKASGISLQGCSTITLTGGNKVNSNGTASSLQPSFRSGISIAFSSFASMNPYLPGTAKDQISNNHGPGIWMTSKGDLMVMGGVINANQGDGVELHGNSTANFMPGAVVTNNTGWGIACYDQQNDSKITGMPGTISGNTLGASKCFQY